MTQEAAPPPEVLILCTDLIFSTKITGTAKALHRSFAVVRTIEKVDAVLAAAAPHPLLILDLNISGVDPLTAIARAKAHANPPRVVAFLSHVQADLATAARTAGADQVMARSAFVAQLPSLLGAEE
jgi:DNA-binding NarL/FixJ family response regulator